MRYLERPKSPVKTKLDSQRLCSRRERKSQCKACLHVPKTCNTTVHFALGILSRSLETNRKSCVTKPDLLTYSVYT